MDHREIKNMAERLETLCGRAVSRRDEHSFADAILSLNQTVQAILRELKELRGATSAKSWNYMPKGLR